MKILGVIPAHMASVRFPNKILFDILGLPMVEHVRRRALLSNELDDVVVATCDAEIANVIRSYGGKVVMTSNTHKNGTSRAGEVVKHYDCSHVLVLQGDEPLLLPSHIDDMVKSMKQHPNKNAWNATGSISSEDELNLHSFVKCAVANDGQIIHCFRKTPYFSDLEIQKRFVRKILGIIAYRKDFLIKLNKLPQSDIESAEFIEQMRIIENSYDIHSIAVEPSLPSVNEPQEVNIILAYIKNNAEQAALLAKILK